MLRAPKKVALAVEAVVDIAYHGGPDPVQSQEIARRLGLPRRYLEQVMQQLVRAGILRGVRGPRGGYRLARERRRITVGDVIRALTREEARALASRSPLGERVMAPLWQEVEERMMARLDELSVEELCRRAQERQVPSEAREHVDFAI